MDSRPLRDALAAIGALLLVAFVVVQIVTCAGCTPHVGRPEARAAVLATAEAVKLADSTCAAVALSKSDKPLADRCAKAYDGARVALVSTASAVDAWDRAGTRSSVTCALREAVPFLVDMGKAIREAGGSVPALVDDALSLVAVLGACEVQR